MPPACRFTREQIVAAALAITRERGFDAVTARAIADTLHSSSKVIFSAFSGMDDLLAATIDAADAQYRAYSADFVRDSADPPYKAVGTAYIRFARTEPNLFHLLYMRDRRREDHSGDAENIAVLVDFPDGETIPHPRGRDAPAHRNVGVRPRHCGAVRVRTAELGRRAHQPDADGRV